MRTNKWFRILIMIFTGICVLWNAGTCFCVFAENNSNVIGSTSIVGGKAVVVFDPAKYGQSPSSEVQDGVYEASSDVAVAPGEAVTDGKLQNGAFYKRVDLSSYHFGEDEVHEIGEFSFSRSGIRRIEIPDTVNKIGYGAFFHCNELNDVTISDHVTVIEPYAFEQSAWLQNWHSSTVEGLLIVGDGILIGYEGNRNRLILPNTIKKIAGSVFAGHAELQSVVLPTSLIEVGEGAFENCTALTNVSFNKGLKKICDRAFAGCPIVSITLPEKLTEIGYGVFDCTSAASESNPVIVFQNSVPPTLVSCNRATRLGNLEYRKPSFHGYPVAVVPKSTTLFNGTVLDSGLYGFSGIICKIDSNKSSNHKGTMRIVQINGEVSSYPEQVEIAGITYQITDPLGLFATYKAPVYADGLKITNRTTTIKPQNAISATIPSLMGGYELILDDSAAVKEELREAFFKTYEFSPDQNVLIYQMKLLENRTHISIDKMGEQPLRLTIPVSSRLDGVNLHVEQLTENGEIAPIEFSTTTNQGITRITLTTNRIAPIILYETTGE